MENGKSKDLPTKEGGIDMPQSNVKKLGSLMAGIGEAAATMIGNGEGGIYLYVEAGDGWLSVNPYRDDSDAVRWFDPTEELMDLIWEAWEAEDPDRRWCIMEYEIRGDKFDAQFRFPDEVDVESMDEDRREIALVKRYGDKPVIYPPIPEHFQQLE
jgi:hypothetical protein